MKKHRPVHTLIRGFLSAAIMFIATSQPADAVSIPAASDTFTTKTAKVTATNGKAAVLTVTPAQQALVSFDLSQLPASYTAANVSTARLRIYVSRMLKPGEISVHAVTQEWSESVTGPAPAFEATALSVVPPEQIGSKRFIIVDVTSAVQSWFSGATPNNGFAIVATGATPTAKLSIGSKEGPAAGFPAELEVETGGGSMNVLGNFTSVIGGGQGNSISPEAEYATIPGGQGNSILEGADWSFAAGRRASVNHPGSFVWADSTNATFTSTVPNQFSIRAANGLFIANDAGSFKVVPVGTRYRDNSIVAWARVTSNGILDASFNIASVTRVSAGRYVFTLNSSLGSGFSLIPVANAEIDPDGLDNVPTGAANVRICATNQVSAGSTFEVYIYNGSFNLVDNDFQVIVTGR